MWQGFAVLPPPAPRPVGVREGAHGPAAGQCSRALPDVDEPVSALAGHCRLRPSSPPPGAAHRPSPLSQDLGAGLAVVPLMGLLESIAVAKSFGKVPPSSTRPPPSHPGAPPALPPALLRAFICSNVQKFEFLSK